MSISLREIVTGVNSGAAASVNIGAGTQAGDLLLAFGWSDFYSLGTFGPPSGGGWTQVPDGTADLGTDNSKCRAWTKTAAGGSATITLSPIIDEDVALAVLVLAGADTTSPVDDADNGTSPGTGSPSLHVAPSVSPSTANAYLVCAAGTSVFNGGAAYTPPGGMTERAEFSTPGSVTTQTVATEQLSASGATGTRTFSYGGNNDPGVAVSVAIRTASGDAGSTASPWRGPTPGLRGPTAEPRPWLGVPTAALAPTVVAVAQVTEADLAQALTSAKRAAAGQAAETSTAQTIGRLKTAAVGLSSEANSAQTATPAKKVTSGQATETSVAQAIQPAKVAGLGLAGQVEAAQAVVARHAAAVTQAVESDSAHATIWAPQQRLVGQVTQTEAAQPITGRHTAVVGQVVDTSQAQPIVWSPKHRLVQQAGQTETAAALTARRARQLGITSESSAAQPAAATKTGVVGQAAEGDAAQPVGRVKAAAIGQASEAAEAQATNAARRTAFGQATEADAALTITLPGALVISVDQVAEADVAQPVRWSPKRRLLGQAAEASAAQGLSTLKALALGAAPQVEQAQPLAARKVGALGQPSEMMAATPLTARRAVAVHAASEITAALTVAPRSTRLVAQASESDTALALTATVPVTTPGTPVAGSTRPTVAPGATRPGLTFSRSRTALTPGRSTDG